jgi:hypothetical protein
VPRCVDFSTAADPIEPIVRSAQPYVLGYTLTVRGSVGTEAREFLLGVGQGAHAKHQFRAGDTVSGDALPVVDPPLETVEFYKIGDLKVRGRAADEETPPHPWRGVPPPLSVYWERGHRRLAARTYQKKCARCIWRCQMPVEMTIDQWNPTIRRYRTETFCYGPRFCPLYEPGPPRKVPGRRGMTYTEEDWVDIEVTSHRRLDEWRSQRSMDSRDILVHLALRCAPSHGMVLANTRSFAQHSVLRRPASGTGKMSFDFSAT